MRYYYNSLSQILYRYDRTTAQRMDLKYLDPYWEDTMVMEHFCKRYYHYLTEKEALKYAGEGRTR